MSNIDPKEICKNCVHYENNPSECRKYAPRGVEGKAWPCIKNKEDWCSEFEVNPPEGEPIDQDHTE